LESITESIFEAKESSKRLRETIEVMKREQEATLNTERERVKEYCKQQHYVEMSQLKEEVNLIKINLEAEGQAYVNKI
jgi:hypothetical protein